MRFAVYLPFKLWIIQTYFPDHSAIIYIPLTVNNLGACWRVLFYLVPEEVEYGRGPRICEKIR